MTDNEIIEDCKNCLHYEACKGTYYSAKGDEDILHEFEGEMYGHSGCENFEDKDLINRKQAEIENITEKFNCQQTVYADLSKIIKEKNTEIERLQNTIITLSDYLDRLGIDKTDTSIVRIATELNAQIRANVKSEAIKEFTERLKEIYAVHDGLHDVIDNLVKEMVGEQE